MIITQEQIDRKITTTRKPKYSFYRDKTNYQVIFASEDEIRTKFGNRAFEEDFELTYAYYTNEDLFL